MSTEMARARTVAGDAREGGVALFETAIGRCGIAWSAAGIRAVGFPERRPELTLERLRRSTPGASESAPPPEVRRVVEAITALLAGEDVDLSAVALDLDGIGPFERRVYEAAREIAAGETITYGELAARIGSPSEAREVGRAMAANRHPIVVPCHRVVAAGGKLGGFSARGGTETKLRLLAIESRHARAPMTLFDAAG